MLRMVVKPLKGEGADAEASATASKDSTSGITAFATPTGKVNVRSGDAKLEVVHVNQTSAMLQREQIGIEPMTQLKRVAPPRPKSGRKSGGEVMTSRDDVRLPTALRRPVATRKDLLEVGEASAGGPGKGDPKSPKASGTTGAGSYGKGVTGTGTSSASDATADKNAKQTGTLAPSSAAASANGSAAGSAPPSRSATPSAPPRQAPRS